MILRKAALVSSTLTFSKFRNSSLLLLKMIILAKRFNHSWFTTIRRHLNELINIHNYISTSFTTTFLSLLSIGGGSS